jgi:uroporphyrinogen decarboxylase
MGPVTTDVLLDSVFLRACRGEPVPHLPVWFMRQAGRALPEYRALREGIPMLQACTTPELIAEITVQPVRRYGVDAAIIFSDIVVPLKAIGIDLDIVPGVGPVVASPFATSADVDSLRPLQPADVDFLDAAVRLVVAELGPLPLIGFAGAPFTLASYLVEGGPSREHLKTKALMYSQPALWHQLLDRLATIAVGFLRVQVGAGARAVQLFDSWAGILSPADYRTYVLPHSARVLAELADLGVPRIHFGVGTGELLALMGEAGADVVGVDWRVPLDVAATRIGPEHSVQGNLDPALVFAPWEVIEHAASAVIARGRAARGHIFNLGHGVLPTTDPDVLSRLVDFVHQSAGPALGA